MLMLKAFLIMELDLEPGLCMTCSELKDTDRLISKSSQLFYMVLWAATF
uniref:Uncharacterized protein n=1 Tax=Rhizophora mucronata TaxID=61149 RepID=A0A2P2Q2X5_RHIMU